MESGGGRTNQGRAKGQQGQQGGPPGLRVEQRFVEAPWHQRKKRKPKSKEPEEEPGTSVIADTSSIAASTEDRDGLPGSRFAFLQSRARVRERETKARLEQLRVELFFQKYFSSLPSTTRKNPEVLSPTSRKSIEERRRRYTSFFD